jgi:hypothetical protein
MSDFCLSSSELERIASQAALMDRMLDRAGANRAIARRKDDGGAWTAARMRCLACPSIEACIAWLDAPPTGGRAQSASFCPNARFFYACQERRLSERL